MVWFWSYNHLDDTLPSAEFRRLSIPGEVTSSKIVNFPGRLEERDDSPFFDLQGPNKKRVEKLLCLPTSTLCPLIDQSVVSVLRDVIPDEEVQYLKANIAWSDRIIGDFYFARPINIIDCIDMEKSKISYWDLEGDLFSDYDKLVLKSTPMAGKKIVRTKYFREILVDYDVKNSLEKINDSSMIFVEPEDMVPWHKLN